MAQLDSLNLLILVLVFFHYFAIRSNEQRKNKLLQAVLNKLK